MDSTARCVALSSLVLYTDDNSVLSMFCQAHFVHCQFAKLVELPHSLKSPEGTIHCGSPFSSGIPPIDMMKSQQKIGSICSLSLILLMGKMSQTQPFLSALDTREQESNI
eukprot:9014642-Ditylum_brightwellii.AAC.1